MRRCSGKWRRLRGWLSDPPPRRSPPWPPGVRKANQLDLHDILCYIPGKHIVVCRATAPSLRGRRICFHTGGHGMKEQIRNHLADQGMVNPSQVIDLCRRQGVQMVDFRFTDVVGTWQHFSAPADELDERMFIEGIGFDGSSIRGFQAIDESDMLLVPDARTARVEPVLHVPTLLLISDIVDPVTRARYTRDPRYLAQQAEGYLAKSGIATTTYWGPG